MIPRIGVNGLIHCATHPRQRAVAVPVMLLTPAQAATLPIPLAKATRTWDELIEVVPIKISGAWPANWPTHARKTARNYDPQAETNFLTMASMSLCNECAYEYWNGGIRPVFYNQSSQDTRTGFTVSSVLSAIDKCDPGLWVTLRMLVTPFKILSIEFSTCISCTMAMRPKPTVVPTGIHEYE